MSTTPAVISPSKSSKKSSVVRKSSVKPPAIQSAVAIRRANGQSKRQIAKALAISQNTVTSILALNNVEEQIAKARQGAIELAPAALTAIDRDLKLPGSGALGLRLLNDIGAVGEEAIDTVRRHTVRQTSAINILVQGTNVAVNSAPTPVLNGNTSHQLPSITTKATEQSSTGTAPPPGKQPKDGVGR